MEFTKVRDLLEHAAPYQKIRLEGEIRVPLAKTDKMFVGNRYSDALLTIDAPNVTLECSGARLFLLIEEPPDRPIDLLHIKGGCERLVIKDLLIQIALRAPASKEWVTAIRNDAFGVKLVDCRVEMISENQINMIGIYNDGDRETHLETSADNLSLEHCEIKAECRAEEFPFESEVIAFFNRVANSISMSNCFLYATNAGCGALQSAVGAYTNGRFGRFVGNNIKANGSHNAGVQLERARAVGFFNEGHYSLIVANNLIGEWAGQAVGLYNAGTFAKVSGNKILATHTVKGRSVQNVGNECVFDGNILTSTSRNPRLFDQAARDCVISGNLMKALLGRSDLISSCGIYAPNRAFDGNVIVGNRIIGVADCGLMIHGGIGIVRDNLVTSSDGMEPKKEADSTDTVLFRKLDERNIRSIG